MSLQISEWVYGGTDPELIGNTGGIDVKGDGVVARFDYMGYRGITREDAMRQANVFIRAMEGSGLELEKLKAIHASLSEAIARAEGQQ